MEEVRFTASEHLIDLLVGQVVYSSPSACVRELLQNSQDACILQNVKDPTGKPSIAFRFSRTQNQFSVSDNGLGMDLVTIKESFAKIGQPKKEVPQLKALIERGDGRAAQIAMFGIGILSCFRVAQSVTVSTKTDESNPLRFTIDSPKSPFIFHQDNLPSNRGTEIDVKIRQDAGFTANDAYNAVFHYARHVENLSVIDSDTGQTQLVRQPFVGEEKDNNITLKNDLIEFGKLGLNESWNLEQNSWRNSITLNNGGFLVQLHDPTILPPFCFGYTGEINAAPGALRMMINREGFVKEDPRFSVFSRHILLAYYELVKKKLANWIEMIQDSKAELKQKLEAMKVILLLLESSLPTNQETQELRQLVDNIIEQYIPFHLFGSSKHSTSLSMAKTNLGKNRTFYIHTPGSSPSTQISQSLDVDAIFQLNIPVRTLDIKAELLGAQGEYVFVAPPAQGISIAGAQQALSYDIRSFLSRYCPKHSIRLQDVSGVADADIQFGNIPLTSLIESLLGYSKKLKFVSLRDTNRRSLKDINGIWLNTENTDIRRMIESVHNVVGNPVKKELLFAYLDMVTFDFSSARQRIEKILLDEKFDERSRQKTGHYQSEHLKRTLQNLLKVHEESSIIK